MRVEAVGAVLGCALSGLVAIGLVAMRASAGTPQRGTYVPPPTPTPHDRPGAIRCWQPDFFSYMTGTSPGVVVAGDALIWCCYEWRGGYMDDGRWVFLSCIGEAARHHEP